MRIGIMLRAIDEKGGVGVYTRYIGQELLELDQKNEYFFYYQNPKNIGRFASYPNVTERVISGSNPAVWDQIGIPRASRKDKLDVVFHPKFTVPFFADCKTVMVLHGAGWFIPEYAKFWKPLDVKYINTVMPLYCKSATAILSVSEITTQIFNDRFNLPPGKCTTVYFGPGKQFKPVTDEKTLQTVKEKYKLPDQFIFSISKYGGDTRKNFHGVLNAYKIHHGKTPHKLVVGGKGCSQFREDYQIPDSGYGKDIQFPDWIDQEDLPAVYALADLFLYPSFMEAFPVPITEALACGKPIVTSNLYGLKELTEDSAYVVDAHNPEDIARGIEEVLTDRELHKSLGEKSLERSKRYSWSKCARETLAILESI